MTNRGGHECEGDVVEGYVVRPLWCKGRPGAFVGALCVRFIQLGFVGALICARS